MRIVPGFLLLVALAAPAAGASTWGACGGPVEACLTQDGWGDAGCSDGSTPGFGSNTATLAAPEASVAFDGWQGCGPVESRRETHLAAEAGDLRAALDWYGVRGNQEQYFHRAVAVSAASPLGGIEAWWAANRYPDDDGGKTAWCGIGAAALGQGAEVPCAVNDVPVLGEVFLRPVEPPPWGGWLPER